MRLPASPDDLNVEITDFLAQYCDSNPASPQPEFVARVAANAADSSGVSISRKIR